MNNITQNISTKSWSNSVFSESAMHTVGMTGTSALNTNRMYLEVNIPTLPRNSRIKCAELVLTQHSYTGNGTQSIGLYNITGTLTEGVLSDLPIDREYKKNAANSEYIFDITKHVYNAYDSGSSSVKLAVKLIDESITSAENIVIYGASSEDHKPTLRITYESSYGINASHHVQTHDLGKFGKGSVDLVCGNLMFEATDFDWKGNRMPLTIKRIYNSTLSDKQYTADPSIGLNTADFSAMKLGYGWRLNLMQSMIESTFSHNGSSVTGYIYTNEQGNETQFIPDPSSTGKYISADDEEIKYDHGNATLTIGDTYYKFTNGRLSEIKQLIKKNDDGEEFFNTNIITYTNDRITKVTDGAGREFLFTYDTNGYLTSIKAPDQSEVTYKYSDEQLYSLIYPDGTRAQIGISDGKPRQVILLDKNVKKVFRMTYLFSGNKLVKNTEHGVENDTYIAGTVTDYSYHAASNRTVVTTTEPADTSEGEASSTVTDTVYTFDNDGNMISEYSYSPQLESTGAASSETGTYITCSDNLLSGHNLKDLNSWEETANADTDVLLEACSNSYAPHGRYALRLNGINSSASGNGIFQSVNTLPAGEYTFSAYAMINEDFTMAQDSTYTPGAYLRVTNANGVTIAESEHINVKNERFERIVLPFTLSGTTGIKVYMLINGTGKSMFCAPQLEKGTGAGEYNMLCNNSFESQSTNWETSGTAVTVSTAKKFRGNSSLAVSGSLNRVNYAYQTVYPKSNPKVRETYTLSGWAKAENALPQRDRDNPDTAPMFRLRATIKYLNDNIPDEYHTADFSPCTDGWQHVSLQFAKEWYASVEEIRISCDYGYNVGAAYFDSLSLTCNEIERELDITDFYSQENYDEDYIEEEDNDIAAEEELPSAFEELTDNYGNTITSTTYADGEFGSIYRSSTYDSNGNNLIIETDARGNTTTYTVDESTSKIMQVTDRCGNKTAYEYDKKGKTTKTTSKKADDSKLAEVSYSYDAFDNMTEIVRGDGMKYVLGYNAFHELESIGVDGTGTDLISYDYKNGNGRLKSMTYANGDRMKATYNALGQMIAETWYDSSNTVTDRYKYTYDNSGNIVRVVDITAEKEYNYTYNNGQLIKAVESTVSISLNETVTSRIVKNTVRYYYDDDGNIERKVILPAHGDKQTVYYEHPENSNPVVKYDITRANDTDLSILSHSKTDSFGRRVFDELQHGFGVTSRRFSYYNGEVTEEHAESQKYKSAPVTALIKEIVISSTSPFTSDRILGYEYDSEERITKVTDSIDGVTEYTYDALGQLLTETVNGTVVNSMTYDSYGNILTKNGKVYTYDTVWKDKLISYNGQSITYDAQGNPTRYLGHTLVWEKGRQLKSYDDITYTYNSNGIRTSKTVDGIKHIYTLEGTKILREEWGAHTLIPLYDNEDNVCGIRYDQLTYFFVKNLQGDVIAITDPTGETRARYTYDAWGKCNVVYDDTIDKIATINPFRYRGYYYDRETGLYYLQSRYYAPDVGRFVCGDVPSFLILNSNPIDYNYFIYCDNNSTNKLDIFGYKSTETYTYNRVKCTKTVYGFSLYANFRLLYKIFCKEYARKVIKKWGSKGKYLGMDAYRIAIELFGHMILFVLGIIIGNFSVISLLNITFAPSIFAKSIEVVQSALSGKVSSYLLSHSTKIDVNYNESWYRILVYKIIWINHPPFFI